MNRILSSVVALGVMVATAASAQHVRVSLGAGGVVPTGDYSTIDNAGWHALGALEVSLPRSPLSVRGDLMYGQTGHDASSIITGSTKLTGGTADLVYHIGAPAVPVRLYLLAGVGYYNVDISGSKEGKVAFGGGTGVSIGMGPAHLFAEGRWMSIQTSGSAMTFLPVTLGMTFGM
ncbi:MAG TPA: outer membrane beta-barrel protein [Gemmatimonadales bacterium]|nr:outer membrane beta-barrel protein [Gemmatimonadales bacterium]